MNNQSQSAQADDIAAHLAPLFNPDLVYELRALGVFEPEDPRTDIEAGLFRGHELDAMAREIVRLSGRCRGIYATINARTDVRFAYMPNARRLTPARTATRDDAIPNRLEITFDYDSPRAVGHEHDPATDAERAIAWANASAARERMAALGWPTPTVQDSGNGYYLRLHLEPFAVEKDDDLIKRVLEAFGADTTCCNPARIIRLPGGMNCKGVASVERPWRMSRILEIGSSERVTREQLEAVATPATVMAIAIRDATATAISRAISTFATSTALTPEVEEIAAQVCRRADKAQFGNGGSELLMAAIRKVFTGCNLSESDTCAVIARHYLPYCNRSITDYELTRAVGNVAREPAVTMPQGCLLPEYRERERQERKEERKRERQERRARDKELLAAVGPIVSVLNGRTARIYCNDCSGFDCDAPAVKPGERCARASISNAGNSRIGIDARADSSARSSELRRIIGESPRARPCRYTTTKLREGSHETTVGSFDVLKYTCGKCGACQERRRRAEKVLHCAAALAIGTHIYHQESEDDWAAMRAKLDRIRKKLKREEPYPFARCIQPNGRRFVVLSIDAPADLLPAELIPTPSGQCVALMAQAIDDIPWKLPKNTTRIQSNAAWKKAGGQVKKPKKDPLYSDLGPVELIAGADLEATAEVAEASKGVVEVVRTSLPSDRIEDRLIVKCAPDAEHEVFRLLFKGSLSQMRNAVRERMENGKQRHERRAEHQRQMKEMNTEAKGILRDLREQYRGREHEASDLVKLLIA